MATDPRDQAVVAGGSDDVDVEKLTAKESSSSSSFRTWLTEDVSPQRAYALMLVCCLISGFIDSTLYNAYGTFVSMQTGNTIFVGLGASGQNNKPYGWARSLLSIAFFVLGSFCFSRVHIYLGSRRRGVLVGSFLTQSIFICVSAAIVEGGLIEGRVPAPIMKVQWNQIAPIALLSFQAAGQIVASRAAGVNEIPTVVITSMLCDLMSDPQLVSGLTANGKRNRRIVAFSLTLIGAIAGGWISKATKGVEAALWVAFGLKALLTIAWSVWPRNSG